MRHLISGRVGSCAAPRSGPPAPHFCRALYCPRVPAGSSVPAGLCAFLWSFQRAPELAAWRKVPGPRRCEAPQHADLGPCGWVDKAWRGGQAWPCSVTGVLAPLPSPSSATRQAVFSRPSRCGSGPSLRACGGSCLPGAGEFFLGVPCFQDVQLPAPGCRSQDPPTKETTGGWRWPLCRDLPCASQQLLPTPRGSHGLGWRGEAGSGST